jgi:Raf kinase inhibitor-like YbhB/YbcL family protein
MTLTANIVALVIAGALGAQVASAGFAITSSAFKNGATIPHQYSYRGYGCDGRNASPDVEWSAAPKATKSFALTLFDPDARAGQGWWHWVIFDIPATATKLSAGAGSGSSALVPKGAVQGRSDFQTVGYGGPCPPVGDPAHHYLFTLYALDVERLEAVSELTSGPDLLKAMRGHVLAKTTLTGRFGR